MDIKPELVDTAQNPIPSNILVGNGSKVRCKFATYWADNKPHDGVKASLYKTQVIDLVEFKMGDNDFLSDGSGFKVGASANDKVVDDFEDELPWGNPDEDVKPQAKATGTTSRKSKDIFDE